MRVLVTGATGFVGRHTLTPLLERGFEVHAVARTPGEADVVWHTADLLAAGAPEALLASVQPTHLLNLAWNAQPGVYWTTPENLAWTQVGIALQRAFAGERAVHAGTCAEYDWSYGLCGEQTPLRPATLYGACKLALSSVVGAYGPPTAWGRIFFLYGPFERPERLVSSVVRSLLAGSPVDVTHGRQVRDFMHVADVAEAFVALLCSDVTGPVNIASGEPTTLRDLLSRIAFKLDGADLIRFGARPEPAGEPPVLLADAAPLGTLFTPRFDLDTGLDDTISWWRNQ